MLTRRSFFGIVAGAVGSVVGLVYGWKRRKLSLRGIPVVSERERVIWFSRYRVLATTRTPFIAEVKDNYHCFQGRGYLFIEPTHWENPRLFKQEMRRAILRCLEVHGPVHIIVVTPYWYAKFQDEVERQNRLLGLTA